MAVIIPKTSVVVRFLALVFITGSACAMARSPMPSPRIRVEPPVQVSPLGAGGHFWGMGNTQASPDDPLLLITCGIRERQHPVAWEGYVYVSKDGGDTWREARIDSTLSDGGLPDQVSETSCAIGRSGTMYMNTSVWGKFFSTPFQLSRSIDFGHLWRAPLQLPGWYDATRSVVDNTGGRFDGRLYIFSNRRAKGTIVEVNKFYRPLIVSDDGGRTIRAAAADIPSGEYLDPGWPSQALVLNDGSAIAIHRAKFVTHIADSQSPSRKRFPDEYGIDVLASRDGGQTLERPVTIGKWRRDESVTVDGFHEQWGLADLVTAMAVDRSRRSFRNRVYAAWREADTASPISRIMMSWSDNAGKNWSTPVRVDDAPRRFSTGAHSGPLRGTDPMIPCLAVNSDGVVGLMWMESMSTPQWRFSVSVDGGASFQPSIAIYATEHSADRLGTQWYNPYMTGADYPTDSQRQFRREWDKVGVTLYTQGDFVGSLAATIDGTFHAFWNVKQTGALWTARIRVDQSAAKSPPLTTAGLVDVSKRVRLEVANFTYDEGSGLLLVDVVLRSVAANTPDRFPRLDGATATAVRRQANESSVEAGLPIFPPLILRVTSLRSEVGALQLVTPDGTDAGGAPLVDLSSTVPHGGLLPGAQSQTRRLAFHLIAREPGASRNVLRVVDLEAQVFSK